MANVVIYIRVSTKEQLHGGSLATQLRACMDYSERHGYEVASVFQEEGESAKTADRSELQRMLTYCIEHQGEVEGVVVYSVDRFSRNVEDFITLGGDLRELGIQLLLATQEVDDTPEGKLHVNMQAVFAQYDNDKRSSRTTEGMRDAAGGGKWVHQAPLGYLDACKTGQDTITPDPERAAIIQEAWRLIDAGYSEAEALRIVTEMGLRNKHGNKVAKQTFSKMLRNPLYMGVVETMGVRVQSASIEPLVKEDLWQRVYSRLVGKKSEPARRRKANPAYPLRGLLSDPEGHRFTGSAPKGSSGNRYPYYHCACKGGKSYPVDRVHRRFIEFLARLSFDSTHAEALREAILLNYLERNEMAEKERKALGKELSDTERKINAMLDKMADGKVPDDRGSRYIEGCEKRECEIKARLSQLGTTASNVEGIWNFGMGVLSDLGGTWENIENIEVKQRFQRWIFPEGLVYDGEKFGTRRIACSLRIKQAKNAEVSTVVPPTRIELVSQP